uniref:CCHC-type domain-containing protein n=1 Tax=Anopheles atroparvus TaxID=41427 RepID=A0AAG5DRL5_ANOAO
MAVNPSDRLPRALDSTNLAKEWPKWKQQFNIFMMATGKINEGEESKIATFLWLIGDHGLEIYNTLFPNNGDMNTMFGGQTSKKAPTSATSEQKADEAAAAATTSIAKRSITLNDVISAFNTYCIPRKNLAVEAFKFNMIEQKENQPFAEFETMLRTQMAFCEFECEKCHASYANRMLRDRLIIGIHDKTLQLKLLDAKDEPLKNVVEMCKTHEAASKHKQLFQKHDAHNVNSVELHTGNKDVASIERSETRKVSCYNCGQPFNGSHRRYCPAKDVTCSSCGRRGHFKKFCKAPKNNNHTGTSGESTRAYDGSKQKNDKNVHMIAWSESGNVDNDKSVVMENVRALHRFCDSNYRVNSNSTREGSNYTWTKKYRVQDCSVEFKLDTGADVNCIPMRVVAALNLPLLNEQSFNVVDYNNNNIKIHGQVCLTCVDEETNTSHSAKFLVVDNSLQPILGLETCIEFGLLKRVASLQSFPLDRETFIQSNVDLFQGLGNLPGTCTIVLKEDATPSLHYKKRIPISLHNRLKEELKAMETQGIISTVDYPTDWVNNMQIVEKPNGSLRICLDPKPLNACIKREHFLIPKSEDLVSRMAG